MKELDAQKLVIDIVREHGGAAHKMAHRFLSGVVDLCVKLPEFPAAFIEVKLEQTQTLNNREFKLDVTPLQKQFMRNYYAANMNCGVFSFIEFKGKGKLGLYGAAFDLDTIERMEYRMHVSSYIFLGDSKTRDVHMISLLEEIC